MAMEPDYWLFADVFKDVPGQHGYQSLWLQTRSQDDCPVCGEQSQETDPVDDIAGDIDMGQFAELEKEAELV